MSNGILLIFLISSVAGVLLLGLLAAFVFNPKFRTDCLAKEGDLRIFKYFSIQGAVVLCLFGVFIFAILFPLEYLPEIEKNKHLEGRIAVLEGQRDELQQENNELKTSLTKGVKTWEVIIPINSPEVVPESFDLKAGVFGVAPPVEVQQPNCTDGVCVFALQIRIRSDLEFEEGIRMITYRDDHFFAYIDPKEVLRRWQAGQTHLITKMGDKMRHYGPINLVDTSIEKEMEAVLTGNDARSEENTGNDK